MHRFAPALAGIAVAMGPCLAAEAIVGRATTIDGDTLTIQGTREPVHLFGIDAPERKQICDDANAERFPCGSRAAKYLADLIGRDGMVECSERDRDLYGRIIGDCATVDGKIELNSAMVRSGWAVGSVDYGVGRYASEEAEAKAMKRGVWAGRFVVPSAWRLGSRLASENGKPNVDTSLTTATTKPPVKRENDCRIKGDIGSNGRVYHLPSQRSYDETKIDEVMGERWFCSEREAIDAGWLASRR